MDIEQKDSVDAQITALSEIIYQLDVINTEECLKYNQLSSLAQAGGAGNSIDQAVDTLASAMSSLQAVQKMLEKLT